MTSQSRISLSKFILSTSIISSSLKNYNIAYKNINKLPEIQKRRLKKYYFLGKTFEEIALEENCTKRAIKFSVDLALKKLRKNFIESKK